MKPKKKTRPGNPGKEASLYHLGLERHEDLFIVERTEKLGMTPRSLLRTLLQRWIIEQKLNG